MTADGVGGTLVASGRVETDFWSGRAAGTPDGPMLDSENIAEAVVPALRQPAGVDVNTLVVRRWASRSEPPRLAVPAGGKPAR